MWLPPFFEVGEDLVEVLPVGREDVLVPLGVDIFVVATDAKTDVKFDGMFGVILVGALAFGDDSPGVSSGVTTSGLGSNND